jgi:hypothetical protein
MDTVVVVGVTDDSLLGAGIVRDLFHNLAVTLISHDLMIPTKLKEGGPGHVSRPHPRYIQEQ